MRRRRGSHRLRGAAGAKEITHSGAAAAVGAFEEGKRGRRIGEQDQQQDFSRGGRLSRATGRGHKRVYSMQVGSKKRKQQRHSMSAGACASAGADDEEIPSDDEEVVGGASSDSDAAQQQQSGGADADNEENVEERGEDEQRLRMARAFLRELAAGRRRKAAEEEGQESDADSQKEDDEEVEEEEAGEGDATLASLLRRQADARTSHAFRDTSSLRGLLFKCFLRGHKLPVTCVAAPGMGDASEQQRQQEFITVNASSVPALDRHIYTGGKDCCVLRWDLQEEKKTVFQGRRNDFHCGGHFRPVLGLCVAPDESFFCSVGADQLLRIWDYRTSTSKCVAALRGHTDAICSVKLNNWPSTGAGGGTGSSFYAGTQSFSSAGDIEVITCGADKSIKLWNLALRACLNSYFGHTAPINAMDVMLPNRPVTVGEDCTARSWKLTQDTHLVFSPQLTSADACCYLTPSLFACGTQGGVISVYSSLQKKPIAAVQQRPLPARSPRASTDRSSRRGVTAMAALRRSEVFFTGSEGGAVQMWRVKRRRKRKEQPDDGNICSGDASSASLQLASKDQVTGIVTSLCLTPSEHTLVAAVSKESRLGRWVVDKEARNGIALFSLAHQEKEDHTGDDAEEDAYTD